MRAKAVWAEENNENLRDEAESRKTLHSARKQHKFLFYISRRELAGVRKSSLHMLRWECFLANLLTQTAFTIPVDSVFPPRLARGHAIMWVKICTTIAEETSGKKSTLMFVFICQRESDSVTSSTPEFPYLCEVCNVRRRRLIDFTWNPSEIIRYDGILGICSWHWQGLGDYREFYF